MAQFEDTFTDSAGTALENHTPDTGTGWSLISGATSVYQIENNGDKLEAVNSADDGYHCDDLSSADHKTILRMADIAHNIPMRNMFVCARLTDNSNFIGWRWFGTGSLGSRVTKNDGGTLTDLITEDGGTEIRNGWVKVESEGDTIRLFHGGTGSSPTWGTAENTATETFNNTVTRQGVVKNGGSLLGQEWITDFQADTLGGGGTTVTGSATLNGTGAVTASGIVTLVGAAALAGVGTLTADAAVAHTGDATLDGQGTLTAQGFLLQRGDAALDGVGTLSVDANVTLGGIAALDGEGTLSAVPTLTLRTSAALDGVGTLTADGTIGGAITGQATLDGIGTLSVSAAVGHTGSAALDGQGALAAVPSLTLRSDSTLDGTGAISVTPTLTLGGDAALDGEGALTADPRLVLRTTATLDGVGTLNATPFFGDLRSRESGWNQFVLDSDGRNSFTVTSGTPNQFEVD